LFLGRGPFKKRLRTMTKVKALITLMVFLGVGVLWAASSEANPLTYLYYQLFHEEGGNWVEYQQGDAFPVVGGNLWKYEYEIHNAGLQPYVSWMTIFFDDDNVDHADYAPVPGAATPANWGVTIVEPTIPIPGFDNPWQARYVISDLAGIINAGETLGGFSLTFTWNEDYLPGAQNYQIGDGISEVGETLVVPEPATLILLGSGLAGLVIFGRRRTR
jgi:hypothetical protein